MNSVEIEPPGLEALFGKYAADPTLTEICEKAYRQRDAELGSITSLFGSFADGPTILEIAEEAYRQRDGDRD